MQPEKLHSSMDFASSTTVAGQGLVRLFDSVEQAIGYVESESWEAPIDGKHWCSKKFARLVIVCIDLNMSWRFDLCYQN